MDRAGPVFEHIYLCSLLWDGLWIIQQPICNQIQQAEPVLFVERPVSIFTVLRHPSLWRGLFAWMRGPRRVSSRLRILAPLPLFHLGHRVPWLYRIEFAIQRRWILMWAGRDLPRLLWLDNPLFHFAIGQMGESMSVYHVADEPAQFRTSHEPTMERLEALTLGKVTMVFAAADELARVRRPLHSRVFPIWNGIDVDAWSAEVDPEAFQDVDAIPAPRVAFVGVLDHWVDLDLLARTARELPNAHIVVVGPSRVRDEALRRAPNIHLIGMRHRRLVPGILRRTSASLVPFVASRLTVNIVPAKVFEALAAGIVPVCTDFSRNLDTLAERRLVAVAKTPEEFVSCVRDALSQDTPERRRELSTFGLQQTWSARWAEMRVIIQRVAAEASAPIESRL